MTDDRFEEFVRRAAQDYHRPPETPRAAMWERIVVGRRQGQKGQWGQRMPWVRWGLAAAAVLALGITIGRFTAIQRPGTPAVAAREGTGGADAAVSTAYQVVALQHLRKVEMFLSAFRTDAGALPTAGTPASARELLAGTRLIMDSPAGQDQRVAALLQDIELLLAQIAHFTGEDGPEEFDMIQRGMERRGVLLKLRSVVPEGLSVATAQGVL
jgi:hypothetical protein